MRIGIISDIHDNIWALDAALAQLEDCQALICLGDFCAPFTLAAIAEGFGGPVHVVWGNNDGDKLLLARNADQAGNVTLHGELATVELDGRRIGASHFPEVAAALARSGDYDLACYGHSHRREVERVGKAALVNPGEVMGRFGVRSLAIYDTTSGKAHIVEF